MAKGPSLPSLPSRRRFSASLEITCQTNTQPLGAVDRTGLPAPCPPLPCSAVITFPKFGGTTTICGGGLAGENVADLAVGLRNSLETRGGGGGDSSVLDNSFLRVALVPMERQAPEGGTFGN